MFGIMRAVIGHVGNILKTCENRQDSFLVVDTGFSLWPGSKFRESLFEIWVGPSFDRNSSKFGRPSAQERKGRTFEKVLCFASGLRIQDPRIHSH